MGKEKMVQIYEAMADITLALLNKTKKAKTIITEDELNMVSATLQVYNFISDSNSSRTSLFDDEQPSMQFTPTDSSGTKYSPQSIAIPCPLSTHEQCQ